MIVNEKFDKKVNEIKELLRQEIVNVEKGTSKKSIQQLTTIMGELEQMDKCKNSKLYMPSFPRYIIDSWDYTDSLGLELINLFENYKKI